VRDKIDTFKAHVREASANPAFNHHVWFVKWHLEIVERIALELSEYYPEADRDLLEVMAWLHDYGKILDYDNPKQKQLTLSEGRKKLLELGFAPDFVERAIANIDLLDQHMTIDIAQTPIEAQIISSADGCSHLTGIFMPVFWNFETDATFKDRTYTELMAGNAKKARKDWERKILLPEARRAFGWRYRAILEQSGDLPEKFLAPPPEVADGVH